MLNESELVIQHTKARNPWRIFGITVIIIVGLVVGFWLILHFFFPDKFSPVELSVEETQVLNTKLGQFKVPPIALSGADNDEVAEASTTLQPEAYSEEGLSREVTFTEREVNAVIAHNTDMADKLAIDLSNNLISAKLLMPMDPEMPFFGGKTLRMNAGVELAFNNNRPLVKLKGISAWGVPIPNAWLGDLKNIDLVEQFGDSDGFWQGFADGIEFIEVSDGKLKVKLKE